MRAITKVFGSATTNVSAIHIVTNEDGTKAQVKTDFIFNGRKNIKTAQIAIAKELKTKNFFIIPDSLIVNESNDETSYTIDGQTFYDNSSVCEPNVSYSREFVTTTFKTMQVMYMFSGGTSTFTYPDITTENKLRNAIIDAISDNNVMIFEPTIIEERRYMPKEKFISLATKNDK